jgi:Ca2+/H+ antiporter, TMEM165/GDT1 family
MRRPQLVGTPVVLFGIGWLGIMGLLTMSLWNTFMPAILRVPAISFWQALALFLLSRVLFGRFAGGSWMRKSRYVKGWKELTPEERERFRRAMGPRPPESFGDGEVAEKI